MDKTLCSACGNGHEGWCREGIREEAVKSGVPVQMIDMIVGRRHVADPVEAIIDDMIRRCNKAKVSEALKAACCKYAEQVHLDNIKLYNDVVRGRIG